MSIGMAWPITATALQTELGSLKEIATRWCDRFSNEAFVANLDEMPDLDRALVFQQMQNELKVAASKSATLVEVLS